MTSPTASKRPLLVFLATNTLAVSLVIALAVSCKKTNDPGTGGTTSTSIQGNWKLTTVNLSPAVNFQSLNFSELVAPLNALENNCIGSVVLTFNANGSVANNIASVTACNASVNSRQLITSFFSSTTTYTETDTQLTLRTAGQNVTANKTVGTSGGNTIATLTTQLAVNPLNQPTPTSYTLVLTKQ
jgi:hypothetical protein